MVQFEIYFPMWRYVDNLMKKGKEEKKGGGGGGGTIFKKKLGGLGERVGVKQNKAKYCNCTVDMNMSCHRFDI